MALQQTARMQAFRSERLSKCTGTENLTSCRKTRRQACFRAHAAASAQTESPRALKKLQRRSADHVPLEIERLVDRGVRGDEALHIGRGLEALHLPLAPSDLQMRVFSTFVFVQATSPMTICQARHAQRRAIRRQAIGDEALGVDALVAKQALQQFQRCASVATPLNNEIKHLAFIVDGAPEVDALTADAADYLAGSPARRGRCSASLEIGRDLWPEPDRPAAHGLVAGTDPALSQQLLDIPKTEYEAEVEPDRVPDHISRKALTLEGKSRHWGCLPPETGLAESKSHLPDSTVRIHNRSTCSKRLWASQTAPAPCACWPLQAT